MAKQKRKLKRSAPKREAYRKILVVCEGEKTEPNYFSEIVRYYKINTANVVVDGSCGSSPSSLTEYALSLYKAEMKKGDAFDQVFCVFDKDTHTTYASALAFCETTNSKLVNQLVEEDNSNLDESEKIFNSITSVPCFEFWILLHFCLTTKPYTAKGQKSCCDCVITDLKIHLKKYKKKDKGLFEALLDRLEEAKANANNANKQARSAATDNPTTYVHDLVNVLQEIKKPKKK